MNRRVLLIDSDLAFRDTLTEELARYGVALVNEPEADRALQLAAADAPSLIILAIDEATKKAGFRVFEKCKKGALSKVPIMLATGTVPADSFAKHRGLKVHADEYLDKRTMTTVELMGKIDGLIELGEPQVSLDEALSIPVEDEIPMEIADGDVVLDEVVEGLALGEPEYHDAIDSPEHAAAEFDQHMARTVGPNDALTMDAVVEAETDAAFAALLGDDDEPGPSMLVMPQEPVHAEAIPEPVPAPPGVYSGPPEDDRVDEHGDEHVGDHIDEPEPHAVAGVVPEPILDGRGRGTTPAAAAPVDPGPHLRRAEHRRSRRAE